MSIEARRRVEECAERGWTAESPAPIPRVLFDQDSPVQQKIAMEIDTSKAHAQALEIEADMIHQQILENAPAAFMDDRYDYDDDVWMSNGSASEAYETKLNEHLADNPGLRAREHWAPYFDSLDRSASRDDGMSL